MTGLIVDLNSDTHPQAEVTGADFVNNLLHFRWVGGPYSGDCSIDFEWSITTTSADVVSAIDALLTASQPE
jgi:hypothetical protein